MQPGDLLGSGTISGTEQRTGRRMHLDHFLRYHITLQLFPTLSHWRHTAFPDILIVEFYMLKSCRIKNTRFPMEAPIACPWFPGPTLTVYK